MCSTAQCSKGLFDTVREKQHYGRPGVTEQATAVSVG